MSDPVVRFNKNARRKDGLQTYCSNCQASYGRDYYIKTPEKNSQRRKSAEERKIKVKRSVVEYLSEHPCVDCGESDFRVLEFDHVRGVKEGNISELSERWSWERLSVEIGKCDIRCANCHRRVTGERGRWYRFLRE